MSHDVLAVPGGAPRTFEAAVQAIAHLVPGLRWTMLPDPRTLATALRTTDAVLLGARAADSPGDPPPAVALRRELGVFAQLRPTRSLRGLAGRVGPVDLLVVRETTEDVYAHLEHTSLPGMFESLKVTTRNASERIARYAFGVARAQGRKRLAIVHKANILKLADGLFLDTARAVAADFPDIESRDVIVDAACMELVRNPGRFDVLLAGNLYGDILGDLCSGLAGGAGNAPVVDVTADGATLFGSARSDRPEADERGDAQPLHILLPAVHLLRHLDEAEAADELLARIERALEGPHRPRALGGPADARTFCEAVAG